MTICDRPECPNDNNTSKRKSISCSSNSLTCALGQVSALGDQARKTAPGGHARIARQRVDASLSLGNSDPEPAFLQAEFLYR
ncbi:MAG: hypothetical protein NTW86_09910 [Candidatus Sumerlaeota bacterium]|nr:hypothetical protein [Candidatus Sumerlaeota bacterium]